MSNSKIQPALDAPKALLYFTAKWCGPCRSFGPVIEQFSLSHPDVVVIKVDADDDRDLVVEYGVRGVPTIFALNDGKVIEKQVGTVPLTKLEQMTQ